MQLVFHFSTLLASLIIAISLASDATALPYRRDAGMVTLPLKRLESNKRDLHPQVVRTLVFMWLLVLY